jgi:hypothetical protein
MLWNNVKADIKVSYIDGDFSQEKLVEEIVCSIPYIIRFIRDSEKIVNKTFIQLMEKLGYDVELTYIKCEEE